MGSKKISVTVEVAMATSVLKSHLWWEGDEMSD